MSEQCPSSPTTLRTKLRQRAFWLCLSASVLIACLAIRYATGPSPASAIGPAKKSAGKEKDVKQTAATQPAEPAKPKVAAVLNGEQITRDELAKECLRHYGTEVLESLVNKRLIEAACQARGVTVTMPEVEEEIDRMARKFSLPKDQWLKMLEKERNIKPDQYGKDIVWPTMALRKLAAAKLTITKKELDEAYESQFGEAVKARLIAVKSKEKAQELRAKAVAKPDTFGALARQHSQDVNSASSSGLIQPIRRHLGDPKLEKAAFALKEGEISQVVQVGDQFVLLKCEGHLQAGKADRSHVDPLLEDALKDRKLRAAASDVFKDIQQHAKVENVYNDEQKRKAMPGVAALINGEKITVRELAEECVERHGVEVLDGTLNRRMLEQELKKKKLTVSQEDIDAEISRAALAMGVKDDAGKPDMKAWLEQVTKEQNISVEVYVRDAVWPSVALKKLVGEDQKITEDDLKKGYEANYGPRMRCRAIILNSQRKAQEVWEKARDNPSAENFSKLAEKYSIEANSASLGGEVPPIQRHGGQPLLEKEAFKLQPGEVSGIIQVGESFIVLYCEGQTKPIKVDFKEVRAQLEMDIYEKKQRIAMAKEFDRIKENATIDNFLAGTITQPKSKGKGKDGELGDIPEMADPPMRKGRK